MNPTLRRFTRSALSVIAMIAVLAGSPDSRAAISSFQFSQTSTTWSSISSTGTRIMSPTVDDGSSSSYSIGFTFNFDGTNYTSFAASSNGLLGLVSGSVNAAYSNSLPTNYGYPIITAFWDDLYLSATQHGIYYQLTGSAPNRVLTVEWNVRHISSTTSNYEFQVKLFEGSNNVQFVYGPSTPYTSQSASIGMSISSGNFASVTPGSPATVSYSSATNNVSTFPSSGTAYNWNLCQSNIALAGNTAEGGTTAMASGDTLFRTTSLTMGSSRGYTPFTASVGATPCLSLSYQFSIIGPNAADYQIAPASGSLGANSSVSPTITFTPRGEGMRIATLTITDNNGLNRTYTLAATGVRRIAFDGNTAQGGTTTMASGDTLLKSLGVARFGTIAFTPLTLRNYSTDMAATPATATYTIVDPSGQYTITPPSASIGSGQTHTPVITFQPTGVGPQYASLVVTVDNETRTYVLAAISAAPQLSFTSDGLSLGGEVVLHRTTVCAGEQVIAMPIVVRNTGLVPSTIRGGAIYRVDTTDGVDLGSRPLLRDASGRLVIDPNYQISSTPGRAPLDLSAGQVWPLTLQPGASTTLYLNFVGQTPGNPASRVILWTDAENFGFGDTAAVVTQGVLNFLVRPNVVGGALSGDANGGPLEPLVFDETKIGDTVLGSIVVANTGACDLRISRSELKFTTGDVLEFDVIRAFAQSRIDAVTNDYLLAPGSTDTIVVRFMPRGRGGRRATLRLETNDSTIYLPGLSERGVRALDVFGTGVTDLAGKDLYLGQVVVGSSVAGTVEFENPNRVAIDVDEIVIEGPDAADFTEDPARPWPNLPLQVDANGKLRLGVLFTAQGAQGRREATIVLRSGTRKLGSARLTAEAGTVELVVGPLSLFDEVDVPAGQTVRRTVMISNAGTFDLHLLPPVLSGPDAESYRLGPLPRLSIAPGGTEYLEVSFSPTMPGQSSATLTIRSTSGASVDVALGGNALGIREEEDEQSNGPASSRFEAATGRGTISIAPTPASDRLAVRLADARTGELSLTIVDARGDIVERRRVESTVGGEIGLDVTSLPVGLYMLRIDGRGFAETVRFVIAR